MYVRQICLNTADTDYIAYLITLQGYLFFKKSLSTFLMGFSLTCVYNYDSSVPFVSCKMRLNGRSSRYYPVIAVLHDNNPYSKACKRRAEPDFFNKLSATMTSLFE